MLEERKLQHQKEIEEKKERWGTSSWTMEITNGIKSSARKVWKRKIGKGKR